MSIGSIFHFGGTDGLNLGMIKRVKLRFGRGVEWEIIKEVKPSGIAKLSELLQQFFQCASRLRVSVTFQFALGKRDSPWKNHLKCYKIDILAGIAREHIGNY
jgi:hypothetical protein